MSGLKNKPVVSSFMAIRHVLNDSAGETQVTVILKLVSASGCTLSQLYLRVLVHLTKLHQLHGLCNGCMKKIQNDGLEKQNVEGMGRSLY